MKFLASLEFKRGNPENATARAVSGANGSYADVYGGGYIGNWDYDKAVRRGYESLIDVFRCVDVIAQNAANRYQFCQQGSQRNGQGRRVDDPQIEYVLNNQANEYETSWQFRYRLSSQLLLSRKGALVEVVPNKEGRVAQLHLIDPGNFEPIRDPYKFVTGFRVREAGGQMVTLDPDQVIWQRLKPHPSDPYSQMTPMVAAGLVVDTEMLARIYNRSIVANNGKASQLILISGHMNPDDAAEIKYRFGGNGPSTAGRTTVLEGDGVQHINLQATPDELQYLQGLDANKNDIFLAFGTPESVCGNASGRTFDNAGVERLNWWTDTMLNHCDSIAAGWNRLTPGGLKDDLYVCNDYDDIDVLQQPKKDKADALAAEVAAGLRTLDSYLIETGQRPTQTAAGRAYWIPALGKIPVGSDEDVAASLAELSQVAQAQQALGAGVPGQLPGAPAQDNSGAQGGGGNNGWTPQQQQQGAVTAGRALAIAGKAERKKLQRPREPETEDDTAPGEWEQVAVTEHDEPILVRAVKEHPYGAFRDRCESEMHGLLSAWSSRQEVVVADRVTHSKVRKGTRHWDGDGMGTKALDTNYIVELERWAKELGDSFGPLISRTINGQMKRLLRELEDSGILGTYNELGGGNPGARSMSGRLFPYGQEDAARIKADLTADMQSMIRTAAFNQSKRLAARIAQMDADGASAAEIQATIKSMTSKRSSWQKSLSTFNRHHASLVEGVVQKVEGYVLGNLIERKWETIHDERTLTDASRACRLDQVVYRHGSRSRSVRPSCSSQGSRVAHRRKLSGAVAG